jgi:hypothetical protein
MPPIPSALAPTFQQRGSWCFSSRRLPLSPYAFDEYVAQAQRPRARDYVVLAHAGHGANSYAFHYYLVHGSLRLFLQLAWGGVYMDQESSTATVNTGFRLAAQLVAAADRARLTGRLRRADRVSLAGSELYGCRLVLPDRTRAAPIRNSGPASAPSDSHQQAVQRALHRAIAWCDGNSRLL